MSKARKINSIQIRNHNPYEGRFGLSYNRVSSKRQESEGSGLKSQEGRCIDDLKSIGVPYERTFADSFSGGGDFMKRPAMKRMIEYIDDNPHKKFVVVFDDLSRFARDVFFHIKLRAEFKKRDVILRCLNYNFDESEEGEFAELIFAGKAELDRKQNRRQVIQKQKARLELGYWAFGSKKAYKMTKHPSHGMLSIPVEPEASLLKEAMEGFLRGTFVHKIDVCEFLVGRGFWNKQKPEKYIDKLTNILQDPFYAGYIYYPEWEVEKRKGHHEGIISLETFEAIQRRLNQEHSGKRIRRDITEDFPLRGLLVCMECRKHMTAAWSQGRKTKYPYYFCQNKDCLAHRKSCSKIDVESQYDSLLIKSSLKKEVDDVLGIVFDRVWSREVDSLKKEEEMRERDVKEMKEQMKEYIRLLPRAKSASARATYEEEIEKLAESIERSAGVIKEDELETPYRTALDKSQKMLKSPYDVWHSVDAREKQRLFHFIFDEKLSYSKKAGYRTDNLPSAVRVFEDFVTSNSQDVEMGGLTYQVTNSLRS